MRSSTGLFSRRSEGQSPNAAKCSVGEDHLKLEEDQGSDVEMLSVGDSESHDLITEATRSQCHDSDGDEAHGTERLHEDIGMPHWQPPDSPKPKKERPTLPECDGGDGAENEARTPKPRKPSGEGSTLWTMQEPVRQEPVRQEEVSQESIDREEVDQKLIDQERPDGGSVHTASRPHAGWPSAKRSQACRRST